MFVFKWSKGLIVLILSLLFLTPSYAQDDLLSHITLRQYPPGSYRIQYGGIRGLIKNQLVRQLNSLHRDWVRFRFRDNPFAAREEMWRMYHSQRDLLNGGAWFTRNWWDSFPENKGGAPARPIISIRGPVSNIIDFGVAYITPDFRFKLREYEVNITEVLSTSSDGFIPLSMWNFRFRPSVKFSTRTLLRSATLNFVFEYSRRFRKLLTVQIYINYSVRLRGIQSGISFSLLQW